MNEISRKPAQTVTELASVRQHSSENGEYRPCLRANPPTPQDAENFVWLPVGIIWPKYKRSSVSLI